MQMHWPSRALPRGSSSPTGHHQSSLSHGPAPAPPLARTAARNSSAASSAAAVLEPSSTGPGAGPDEKSGTPTRAPKEHVSTLQDMMNRSTRQQQHQQQQKAAKGKQPAAADSQGQRRGTHRWHAAKRRAVLISTTAEAGAQAGALAAMLRARSQADVSFHGVVAINKCLRVLALANLFLRSHDAACSFVFAPITWEQHQERLQQLYSTHTRSEHNRKQAAQHNNDVQLSHSPRRARGARAGAAAAAAATAAAAPAASAASAADVQASNSQRQLVPGQAAEPTPEMPLLFNLHVWSRPAAHPEVDPVSNGRMQLLDFALDIRQEWRRQAYLSFDTALSIADNLHRQLTAQCDALAQQQRQQQQQQAASRQQQAAASTQADGTAASSAQPLPQQPQRTRWPCMVFGVDMSQAVLVFAALSFVEQRLREERHSHQLVVTVLRNHTASGQEAREGPARLDGRNGFLIKLELQQFGVVRRMLSRRHIARKADDSNGGNGSSRNSGGSSSSSNGSSPAAGSSSTEAAPSAEQQQA